MRVLAVGVVGALALAVVVACGASGSSGDDGSSGGSSSGASGTLGSSGATDGGGDLGNCGYESHTAQALPLDLVFLIDDSYSMTESPGGGATKWSTVKSALATFAADPKSAGIGAGLQIFPIRHAGAPSSCSSTSQCTGGFGICTLHACALQNRNDPFVFCDTSNDCPGKVACNPWGTCIDNDTGQPDAYCEPGDPVASTCPSANDTCVAFMSNQGQCSLDECFDADYATPKAAIAPLPGGFAAALAALPDPAPANATPTAMAIKSGLELAKAYGTANAGHALAVVIATDGLPTRCDPMDIPGLSALIAGGLSASPSIKTFVIGVFTPTEAAQAQANLDALAKAGGSNKAFIVNAAGNLGADFQSALATVRGAALPCEYTIPPPSGGSAQDFGKVNVEYTSGAGARDVLGYKTSMAMCGTGGGWYYDVDPSSGTPTKIIVCPATCDALKADTGAAKLDILLGCKTIIK